MARTQRKRIGEILTEWGVITRSGLKEALAHGENEFLRIGEALVELNLADEVDVAKALAFQHDMEYIDIDTNTIVPDGMDMIPPDLMRKHLILPLAKEDGKVKVIITDPLDLETLDMLRFRLNCEVAPCLAPKNKLKEFIDTFVRRDLSIDNSFGSIDQTMSEIADKQESLLAKVSATSSTDLGVDEDAAPIVKLATMLITEAVTMRASDIHIEPMTDRVRVRYRIDGVCIERDNIPKRMQGPILNRVKLLAGIDLAEKRLPQDGRIKMNVEGTEVDFRVSALPSYHGESIVLRILRPESARVGIRALGFENDDYARFQQIIKKPTGVFLVTGPTGSGKTTTLYSALNELNNSDRKIITAEDPIEYNFSGINQVQVNEQIGLSFSTILRSMLRQAPNIILVGEIRDSEVAEVAIQAALTGHLVFSTLHTNDAASAITRLIDMGVKPFLVASSIQAVLAQRLIRVICENCKEPDPTPDARTMRLLGFTPEEIETTTFYKGKGCDECDGTGYHGRQGIFELMEMDNPLRELAFKRSPVSEVRRTAIAGGMKPLVADGRNKVRTGVTTVDELVRVTQVEGLFDE